MSIVSPVLDVVLTFNVLLMLSISIFRLMLTRIFIVLDGLLSCFVDFNTVIYILVPLAVGHVAQHCHLRLLIIRAKLAHWAKCERC
jgi:hypothetical protein